jgi:hypothetical protein
VYAETMRFDSPAQEIAAGPCYHNSKTCPRVSNMVYLSFPPTSSPVFTSSSLPSPYSSSSLGSPRSSMIELWGGACDDATCIFTSATRPVGRELTGAGACISSSSSSESSCVSSSSARCMRLILRTRMGSTRRSSAESCCHQYISFEIE